MTNRSVNAALLLFALVALEAMPARANLFTLAASGTISSNSSGDSTIPVGTPWAFDLTYETASPDVDFELTTLPDPTYGRFTNTAVPPALMFFHYQAADYQVAINNPADFGPFSEIHITFTSVNAIDININASALFPQLAGKPVSFHADFNSFSTPPIFSSDALPTNTNLGPASFGESTVSLLPQSAGVVSSSTVTGLTLTAVPPGDYNHNGVVDAADYTVWRNSLGSTNDLRANGDNQGASAGVIDQADYAFWKSHFGNHAGSGADIVGKTAVPEPATLWILIAGIVTMCCRRFTTLSKLVRP